METRKRVLGEEHPSTLTSMYNLAFTWKAQSQDTKAINLIQGCIRLRSRILGVDHSDTSISSTVLEEWKVQEPEINSFTINNMTNTKEESKRADEASNHTLHLKSKKEKDFDYAQAKTSFMTSQLAIYIGVLRLWFQMSSESSRTK